MTSQGYWQSAIAARPSAAHTGYLLGGILWFCIPFTLATTMGLAALAADLPITLDEAGSGDWPASLSGLCAGRHVAERRDNHSRVAQPL